jgi:dUTP pyrophosphatase
MKIRHCVACVRYVHWTLKVGGKVIFEDGEVLPQRWDIGWGRFVNCVEIKDEGDLESLMNFAAQESVRIKVLKLDAAAQLPRYAHVGEFGDLAADLYAVAATTLKAGETAPVATGVAMEFPSTHGALVEDRSGLAMRGVTTLAGVIDPGYRGEIRVVVTNLSASAVEIKAGDRIAQLRIVRRIEAQFDEVSELVEAPRGANGFGSTGS